LVAHRPGQAGHDLYSVRMFRAERPLGNLQCSLQGPSSAVEISLRLEHRSEAGEGHQCALVVTAEAPFTYPQRPLQTGPSTAQVAGGRELATQLEAESRRPLVVAVRGEGQRRHEVKVGYRDGPED